MELLNNNAGNWTAVRMAAVAIMLAGFGCAAQHVEQPEPSTENVLRGDVESSESSELPAPPVNVFGETDAPDHAAASSVAATQPVDATFEQHTKTEEGYDSDVAVDPSGKWLVFASTRESEHAGIYLQQVDGTAVVQLTNDNADAAHPVFSPDGKQIAFGSTRSGSWQIYLMDIDGRNVTQVTQGPMQAVHPSFSPDGTRIVYAGLGTRSGQWELWIANLSTGEKRMIGLGLAPRWSPDKSADRIAFQRPRQRGSRLFSLWTLELSNDEALNVTEVVVSGSAAVLAPSWSPDGRKLAFATVSEPTRGESRKRPRNDIWTSDADGSNRRRLTDGVGASLTPFWSGDGRVYFISDRAGAECVWSVQVKAEAAVARDKRQEPALVGTADTSDVSD